MKKSKLDILLNLVIDHGVSQTLKITGLDVIQLFNRLGDKIEIDHEMAYELITLLLNTKILPKNVNGWNLDLDSMDGILYWTYKNENESVVAMCTPFWEGSSGIPVDFSYSMSDDEEQEYYRYIGWTENFNSLEELITWFKDFYIPVVLQQLNVFLEGARKKFGIS